MIILILGAMNTGKTLVMSYLLFKDFMKGYDIITNYDVTFPHHKLNKDYLTLLGKEQPMFKNTSFGFDELWIWVDSRRSSKESNIYASYFLNQSSKDDSNIFITAQYIDQIDVRIRNNCHRIIKCSRVIYLNGKMKSIDESKRFLPKYIQDRLYIKIIKFKKINVGFYTDFRPEKIEFIKANLMFNLFKTTQKVSHKGEI